MKKTPNRWLIVAVSCIMNLCLGTNYAWSVFAGPLAQRLNEANGLTGGALLNAGSLAIVFTTMHATTPVSMIIGGAINDRSGPRGPVFTGGLMFGAGMILTGLVTSVHSMVLVYGLLAGLGFSLVYTCTINNTVKFFPDKKGLIGGLTTAFYGLGPVVLSPVIQIMIERWGVSYTLMVLGIIFAAVVCAGSFFLAKCPTDYAPAGTAAVPLSVAKSGGRECNWREMMRQPVFYVMLALFGCGSLQGLMMISQASTVAQEMAGMPVAAATAMVSLLALFNASGRALCGFLSDKLGRINVITTAIIASCGGLLLLYASAWGGTALFAVGICVVGFCFGCFLGVFPGFTADRFGIRHNSVNYGIMFLGVSLGSLTGPSLMHLVRQAYGTYQQAFLIAAALAIAGLALTFVYRKIERKEAAKISAV